MIETGLVPQICVFMMTVWLAPMTLVIPAMLLRRAFSIT